MHRIGGDRTHAGPLQKRAGMPALSSLNHSITAGMYKNVFVCMCFWAPSEQKGLSSPSAALALPKIEFKHTHTYTLQSVPGGIFQALRQPNENPLECTRYRDHLRRGLGQDCLARKAYEMPMGGAKGALWTPPMEGICTFGVNMHK